MPVHRGKNNKGPYMQMGESGKKYYYKEGDKDGRSRARSKADKQSKAMYSSGYRGNKQKRK